MVDMDASMKLEQRRMTTTICDSCGKIIERNKYEIETCEHHFCNRKCQGGWYSKNRICASHPNWIDVPKNEIVDLYESGCTITKIGKIYHISHGTIYSRFKKWGIPLINKNAEIECDNCGKKTKRGNCLIKAYKHHFCNKKCYAQWKEYPIQLEPTYALGYLIGVIFGDGYISPQNQIIITTADIDWIGTLITIINEICPQTSAVGIYSSLGNKAVHVHIHSKKLCKTLKPFKPKPARYYVPTFLNTRESLAGFIAGLIDTDGCIQVHKKNSSIALSSKYYENLVPIKKILEDTFKISSKIYISSGRNESTLRISGYLNLFQFENDIGLLMLRRQILLRQLVIEMDGKYKREKCRKQKIEKIINLYKNGVPLKQITKKLQICDEYIYKIIKKRGICKRRTEYTPKQYYNIIKLRKKTGYGAKKLGLFFPDINQCAIYDWIHRDRKPLSVHHLEAQDD